MRSTPAFCLVALVFLPGCSSLGNGLCPKSLWNWASRDEVKVAFSLNEALFDELADNMPAYRR